MTKAEFLKKIEMNIMAEEGTLSGSETLADLDGWDSLAVMSTLALLDKLFGVRIAAEKIYQCRTVDDVAALAGGKLAD